METLRTSDRATSAFVITITNDESKLSDDPTCVADTPDPDLAPNTLSSLVVTYTLDGNTDIPATLTPEFDPTERRPVHGLHTARSDGRASAREPRG